MSLSGLSADTSAAFFEASKTALEFPDYFGANWAAFDECLGDLLDLSEGGLGSMFGGRIGRSETAVLVMVQEAEELLAKEPVESVRTLVEITRAHAMGKPSRSTASLQVHVDSRCSADEMLPALYRAGVRKEDLRT